MGPPDPKAPTELRDSGGVAAWQAVFAGVSAAVLRRVARCVELHATELAEVFAQPGPPGGAGGSESGHQDHPATSATSVAAAMGRWLLFLLDEANREDASPIVRMQLPLAQLLLDAGWSGHHLAWGFIRQRQLLKQWLSGEAVAGTEQAQTLDFLDALCDTALLAVMGMQQGGRAEPPAPSSRPLSGLVQGRPRSWVPGGGAADPGQLFRAGLDEERQVPLGVLSDEENQFLRSVLEFGHTPDGRSLGTSVFGVWLSQRAPLLFDDTAMDEISRISRTLTHLDVTVLPRLSDWLTRHTGTRQQAAVIRELVAAIAEIRQQVNGLFDRLARVDGYRDALTQLFSRPFLPTILRREIELARRRQSGFSLLVLDIGNFQDLQTLHGVHAGDRLLQQVAGVLSSQVRASDFVFRYGSGAFLILLAELTGEESRPVAEKLMRQLTDSVHPGRELSAFAMDLNAGVAAFDGDPDPERLTQRAEAAVEAAVEAARDAGQNQVRVAA